MVDRTVVYRLQADVAGFEANVRHAGASVRAAAGDMTSATREGEKFRRGLTTVGDTAGKVGLVAAAGLGAAVKAAVDWESAWAGVTKTVDGSSTQINRLEGDLREMARTLPASHDEIAAVAEAAGQLGVAVDDVAEFSRVMIDLGNTTNLSADEAATAIAQFMNVLQSTPESVERIGNTLVDLGNKGASTEKDIVELAQRLSGAGKLIGASEADVLGMAAAMANLGIEAELGGGAMSRAIAIIQTAVADGGSDVKGFADVSGMTAKQFTETWKSDPTQAIAAFVEGLQGVTDSGGNVIATLADLNIKGTQNRDVLLRLAGSGDMLSKTLDQADKAWEQNSALAIEAGKRYDTTASQTQVAWNRIKDAGIEAGESLLPVVAGVADAVGSLADTFGSLPDPVQKATTGLLGITAVFGGGLWFTAKVVNGVTTMKGALDDLGFSSDKASTKLGKVGRAAGVAGAGLAALAVVDTLQRQFDGLDTGLEGVTKQLLNLGGVDGTALSGEFSNIADSFDRLTDPNKAQAFQDSIYDTLGFLGSDSRVDEAVAQFEALDAGLTNIAASAGADTAKQVFASLAESMGATGEKQRDLLALLPQYADALEGSENAASLKAISDEEAASAAQALGAAATQSAEEIKAQKKALQDAREAARGVAEQYFSVSSAVDDAEGSLEKFLKSLERQANALVNVRENAKLAAENGIRKGLINELEKAGPAGAVILEKLANGTETQIGRANAAFKRGEQAKRDYVNFKIPPTKIEVKNAEALTAIERTRIALANIKDKTVTLRVTRTGATETPGFGPQENAAGGFITGPGTGTSDSIPSYLSNGEYVIKAAAVEKYGVHMFDRLNAMHFAEGGSVKKGDKRKPTAGLFVYDNTDKLQAAIDRLTLVQQDQTDALESATTVQQRFADAMQQAGQNTLSNFGLDLFSKSSDPWSAGASDGPIGNLTSVISGLQDRIGLQYQLGSMGLSGEALSQLLTGTNADISGLIARGEVGQYAQLYGTYQQLASQASSQAGQLTAGREFAAAAAETKRVAEAANRTNLEMVSMNGRLARMEMLLQSAPDETGNAVGRAVNGAASKGHQDRMARGGPVR